MAPQESIPVAANILGTVGTVLWCIQLLPQIWYNWRRKQTDGLPGLMLMLWAAAAPPFGVYAIVQNLNIPVQTQPHVFGLLCLVCWAQTLVYHDKWRVWTASLAVVGVAVIFAGIECLLIFTLRGPYQRGIEWPMTVVGVVAAIILAVGLLPPYVELWKRNGRVIGINFIFLTVDFSGALLSLLSLAAQNTFDVLGGVLYIVCLLLETGIFISQGVWLYRTREIRKAAKQAGKSYDEYVKEHGDKIPDVESPTPTPAPTRPASIVSDATTCAASHEELEPKDEKKVETHAEAEAKTEGLANAESNKIQ